MSYPATALTWGLGNPRAGHCSTTHSGHPAIRLESSLTFFVSLKQFYDGWHPVETFFKSRNCVTTGILDQTAKLIESKTPWDRLMWKLKTCWNNGHEKGIFSPSSLPSRLPLWIMKAQPMQSLKLGKEPAHREREGLGLHWGQGKLSVVIC